MAAAVFEPRTQQLVLPQEGTQSPRSMMATGPFGIGRVPGGGQLFFHKSLELIRGFLVFVFCLLCLF